MRIKGNGRIIINLILVSVYGLHRILTFWKIQGYLYLLSIVMGFSY